MIEAPGSFELGAEIPDLALVTSNGQRARLTDFRGGYLILYFYPKANTPGCTQEGQDFAAALPAFERLSVRVLGVSRDGIKAQANFRAKQGFPFELVADSDATLCRTFGVLKEKVLYGRRHIGIERSTFLLDPQGRLAGIWRGVKVPGHVATVLSALTVISSPVTPSGMKRSDPGVPPARAEPCAGGM